MAAVLKEIAPQSYEVYVYDNGNMLRRNRQDWRRLLHDGQGTITLIVGSEHRNTEELQDSDVEDCNEEEENRDQQGDEWDDQWLEIVMTRSGQQVRTPAWTNNYEMTWLLQCVPSKLVS